VIDPSRANLNLLVVFDILMREQNLTKTGQVLSLSQPAISHALKGLREMFNDDLFVKSSGGMRPTDHAIRLIEPVRQALAKIETVLNIEDNFDPEVSNRVFQLGLSDYATFMFLPPVVARLARESPNVSIDVQHINKPEKSHMLDNGDIEMSIALFESPPKSLEYQELFNEKLVCIADKNNKDLEDGLTLEKFVALPHLLISSSEEPAITVQKALANLGLKRHVALKVRHVVPAGYVVKNSSLIAVLPERLALFLEKMIDVKIHPIPLEIETQKVMLVWHKRNDHDAGLKWLREHVIAVAKKFQRREFKDASYEDIMPIVLERSVIRNDEEDPEH